MLIFKSIKFEHNRIVVRLSDGREETRHLLNWPFLFTLVKSELEQCEIVNGGIYWPMLNFRLSVAEFLKAKKL